jgi:3-oxoacyl-[acyl-carrier-protein] synthase III
MKTEAHLDVKMIIINKFKGITGIEHRRYAETNQTSSDLAFLASEKAIENAESILKLLTTLFLLTILVM